MSPAVPSVVPPSTDLHHGTSPSTAATTTRLRLSEIVGRRDAARPLEAVHVLLRLELKQRAGQRSGGGKRVENRAVRGQRGLRARAKDKHQMGGKGGAEQIISFIEAYGCQPRRTETYSVDNIQLYAEISAKKKNKYRKKAETKIPRRC